VAFVKNRHAQLLLQNFGRNNNAGARWGIAQRIIQEVRNCLADLDKIKWSEGRIVWNISPDSASRADRFHAVKNVVNDVRDRYRIEVRSKHASLDT